MNRKENTLNFANPNLCHFLFRPLTCVCIYYLTNKYFTQCVIFTLFSLKFRALFSVWSDVTREMALKGLRVIEMAGLAPVPYCGQILADYGAQVIRIDRAGTKVYCFNKKNYS